jgi:hypothetical protein
MELSHAEVRRQIRESITSGNIHGGRDLQDEAEAQFRVRVFLLAKAMKEIGKTLSERVEGYLRSYGMHLDGRMG